MAAQSIKIGVRNWLMHPGWCDLDLLTGLDRFNLLVGRVDWQVSHDYTIIIV